MAQTGGKQLAIERIFQETTTGGSRSTGVPLSEAGRLHPHRRGDPLNILHDCRRPTPLTGLPFPPHLPLTSTSFVCPSARLFGTTRALPALGVTVWQDLVRRSLRISSLQRGEACAFRFGVPAGSCFDIDDVAIQQRDRRIPTPLSFKYGLTTLLLLQTARMSCTPRWPTSKTRYMV